MTKDKLTLEDCFKYPEAPLINQLKLRCENLTEFITAVDGHDLEFILQNDGFKLILRDISQLTDEEKKYINDNLFYDLFKNTVSLNANAIWNSFDELLAVCEDKTALIDYLRGNNIMIEKPDWFAIGKAVKDEDR